jgi:hypothetical protein
LRLGQSFTLRENQARKEADEDGGPHD